MYDIDGLVGTHFISFSETSLDIVLVFGFVESAYNSLVTLLLLPLQKEQLESQIKDINAFNNGKLY
jgi:hypothetical protein